MFVVAEHAISNPQAFWSAAEKVLPELPGETKILLILPDAGGTRAVCLWEAESVDAVRKIMEPTGGDLSRNEYFAVDERKSFGLVD